ncbi:MAG: hypothetical protein Q9216_003656, partial [Gyalolechia sp. 2 TL-2023]
GKGKGIGKGNEEVEEEGEERYGNKEREKDEEEEEIKAYDRKVYRAYGEMIKATRDEFKRMGIPFFDLVPGGADENGKLSEEELERLRGRMVEFLEDMVRE